MPASRPLRATTLLASVEPCSAPAAVPSRALLGHHAARQRGAMFSTSRRPVPRPPGPPRCSPAWSHVQHQSPSRPTPSSGHHAARQRGAMFSTSRRPVPRPPGPPRCSPAWWRRGRYPREIAAESLLRISEQLGLPPVLSEKGEFIVPYAVTRLARRATRGWPWVPLRELPPPAYNTAGIGRCFVSVKDVGEFVHRVGSGLQISIFAGQSLSKWQVLGPRKLKSVSLTPDSAETGKLVRSPLLQGTKLRGGKDGGETAASLPGRANHPQVASVRTLGVRLGDRASLGK